MRINEFPWSPVLAGFSAGVVGFVAAALAVGVVHLGPADHCRLHDHQVAAPVRATTLAENQVEPHRCPCCCEGHRTVTTAGPDDATLQLVAIEPPREPWNCEEEGPGPWNNLAQITPTSDRAAPPDSLNFSLEPARILTPDSSQDPVDAFNRPTPAVGPAADRGWSASLANASITTAASPLAALGGPGGSGSFGAGGGGSLASRPASGTTLGAASADSWAIEATALTNFRLATLAWEGELAHLAATTGGRTSVTLADLSSLLDANLPLTAPAAGPVLAGSTGTTDPTSLAVSPTIPTLTDSPSPTVTVPEPTSISLATLGLACLGLAAWRRRRR